MFINLNKRLPALQTFGQQLFSKKLNSLICVNPRLLSQIRLYCSTSQRVEYKTFDDFLVCRREEAQRSFVVQVFSEQSCWDLHDYLNAIAPIRFMQHYSTRSNNHFVIAELLKDELNDFFETCRHLDDIEVLPVKSPFLWFKTCEDSKKKKIGRTESFPTHQQIGEDQLLELLSSTNSLTDQMRIVYETTKLDEVGIRLRFVTARQVELALTGLFPNCTVLPFGSSVNGFGKCGCDLDVGLRYSNSESKNNSRLVFQSKEGGHTGRPQIQRQMEILADILHLFLPGCSSVRRILKARVPIVKYSHDFTGLECDLSMTDLSGIYMSELLWLYGNLDSRVRPLVFTVRRWAESVGLTSPIPGKYITNFALTALVLFYLQTVQILPSFMRLVKLAQPGDSKFAGEVNCTFVRDASLIALTNDSTDMGTLLCGFFEYFSNFDYERCGICIRSGKPVSKPDHSPLYLVNPLESSLNVSRNISPEELTRLKVECRNASWLLQSNSSLLNIFKSIHLNQHKTVHKTGKRLVSMKHLFKSQNIS